MHSYSARTFDLPVLEGISEKQVAVHLGLYEGYVKHVNLLREQVRELTALDKDKYAFAITELRRRFSFEFDGMRMHEYYFAQFEGGPTPLSPDTALATSLIEKYGTLEAFVDHVKMVGMSRGIGWTILYYDHIGKTPHVTWIGDHELGQFAGLPIILAMDMWEHAFMVDYVPAEKKNYIEAFLKNVNWGVAEGRFEAVSAE